MKYLKSLTIVILFLAAASTFAQSISEAENNRKEAERIWELAIQAKDGREKIHAVKNMVVSSRSKVKYSLFKTYENVIESLYIFPDDKYWCWNDSRPSMFGVAMSMYNYKTLMKYHQVLGSPDNYQNLVSIESNELVYHKPDSHLSGMVSFLLENEFWQPAPQSVSEGRKGTKKTFTVRTLLNGERIDFVLDQKTHFLVQSIGYFLDKTSKQERKNVQNYENYKEFAGIMMPTKVSLEGESGSESLSYQFNVEYDKSLFTTPPSFEKGREAWRTL